MTTVKLTPEEALFARNREFKEEIIKVANGVYFARSFGAGNLTLIEGDNGVIVVDTVGSIADAEAARASLEKLCPKPVKAIIYTHSHADHTGGAAAFAKGGSPEVISREPFGEGPGRAAIGGILMKRLARQFGAGLSPEEFATITLSGANTRPQSGNAGYLPPTKQFSGESLNLTIAGVDLELVAAPGEAEDTLFVWVPQRKVLMCGDDYYKSFPNLYAIRGDGYRDIAKWVASLDKMIAKEAEVLLPGHTEAVIGKDKVKETLTNFRDGIDFVLQELLRLMNQGLSPDEVAAAVKLPPDLADKPYLQEMYGTVAWSARSVYSGYLGWFDGNPSNLNPMPPRQQAECLADLAGGADNLLAKAEAARDAGNAQWSMELADVLLALGLHVPEAKRIKIDACRKLARQQTSANGRHYYFVCARELEQTL